MFSERGFIGILFFLFVGVALVVGILMLKGWQSHNMNRLLKLEHQKQVQIEDLRTECLRHELLRNQLSSRDRIQAFAKAHGLSSRGDSVQIPVILEVTP